MTSDDRAEVDRLIDEALSLPPEQWEPLAKARFADRPDLIGEVKSLLEHAKAASARFPAPEDVPLPKRAGVYRLIQELGRGGMGVVFLGERDDGRFEQRVAVKLLPPIWGLPESGRRFDAECRILARLEHPRICRILDSGRTPEGWPFLAMELVDGQTLDKWCAAASPSEAQKIEVFLQICDAVRYAHTNLVIHRDLKPQNVVITQAGDAKLLDFGVAKLLSPDGAASQPTVPMLTLKYASPEQVAGEPATTASDVYSLGVMLRELAARAPREDLQAIADKAAAAEPSARYGSVAQLAEDVNRYLERAPVLAKRQTFGYVASRLLRRYRKETAVAVGATILVVAGVAGVLWQGRVAARERARAVQHATNIRRLAETLVFDLHDRIENVPGALDAREALLTRGTEYLDILARDAGSDVGLLIEVSKAYRRLAALQFETSKPTRLDLDGAVVTLEKAEAAARRAIRFGRGSRESRMELLRVLVQRVSRNAIRASWRRTPNQEGRAGLAEEVVALARQLSKEFSGDVEILGELASAQFSVAATYEDVDIERAIQGYREAVETSRQALLRQPEDAARQENVARTLRSLGVALSTAGHADEAKACLKEALALDEQLLARQPGGVGRALMVTFDLSSLFTVAARERNWSEALTFATRTTEMREEIVRHDPSDQIARLRLWFAHTNAAAEALVSVNRPAEALESLARGRVLESGFPTGTVPPAWLARARYNEAIAREQSGGLAAACSLFRESDQLLAAAPSGAINEQSIRETQNGLKRCGWRPGLPVSQSR